MLAEQHDEERERMDEAGFPLEPTAQDERNFRPVKALFHYPLAVSWALWLCVLMLGTRRGVYAGV
jgi:hypothetical protein